MNETPSVSEILRFHLQHTNRPHADIAHAAKISPNTLKNWLTGKTQYPRDLEGLIRLADQLSMDASDTQELLNAGSRRPRVLEELYEEVDEEFTLPALQRILNRATVRRQSFGEERPLIVPPISPYFVERPALQQRIERYLFQRGQKRVCLVGMGGVGKSMLAIHLAHQLQDRFDDGVLWVSLENSETTDVLNFFARAYGESVVEFGDISTKSAAVRGLLGG